MEIFIFHPIAMYCGLWNLRVGSPALDLIVYQNSWEAIWATVRCNWTKNKISIETTCSWNLIVDISANTASFYIKKTAANILALCFLQVNLSILYSIRSVHVLGGDRRNYGSAKGGQNENFCGTVKLSSIPIYIDSNSIDACNVTSKLIQKKSLF